MGNDPWRNSGCPHKGARGRAVARRSCRATLMRLARDLAGNRSSGLEPHRRGAARGGVRAARQGVLVDFAQEVA